MLDLSFQCDSSRILESVSAALPDIVSPTTGPVPGTYDLSLQVPGFGRSGRVGPLCQWRDETLLAAILGYGLCAKNWNQTKCIFVKKSSGTSRNGITIHRTLTFSPNIISYFEGLCVYQRYGLKMTMPIATIDHSLK